MKLETLSSFPGVPFNDTLQNFFDTYKVNEDIECYQLLFCPYGTKTSFKDLKKMKFNSRIVILNIMDLIIDENDNYAIDELTDFCSNYSEHKFIIFNFQLNIQDQLKIDNLYTDTIQSTDFAEKFIPCKKKNITNNWLSFNRDVKLHRVLTVCYLLSRDYYENGTITFKTNDSMISKHDDYKNIGKMSDQFKDDFIRGSEIFKLKKFNKLIIRDFDTDTETVVNNYNVNLLPVYENIGIEIITGTSFFEKTPCLSEKEFQSFYGKTFPIYINGVGMAKEIKNFFDVDIFEDIIDHSYDTIEDHYERLSSAVNKNQKLLDGSTNIKELWFDNQKRFEENCNKVDSMLNDKEYQKISNYKKIKKALTHFNCSFK